MYDDDRPITIVKEKEMGTMEIMLVSPMRPQMVVLAKQFLTYYYQLSISLPYCY
jgi:hypothetical protein